MTIISKVDQKETRRAYKHNLVKDPLKDGGNQNKQRHELLMNKVQLSMICSEHPFVFLLFVANVCSLKKKMQVDYQQAF